MSSMLLEGKIAIVTGAGRGLGKAMAQGLASHGAIVVIAEIDETTGSATAEELARAGHHAIFVPTDVASEDSVDSLVAEVVRRHARIDVLVNNAGLAAEEWRKPFYQFTAAQWDRMLVVNLRSMFFTTKAVFPQMRDQRSGSIVNISSATIWYGIPDVAPYLAAKGGVIGLTRALARELGQYNIRVNAITPGRVMTNPAASPEAGLAEEERAIRGRCLPRAGVPMDLAGTVVYLASDLSAFVTGQTINVDGGFAMH